MAAKPTQGIPLVIPQDPQNITKEKLSRMLPKGSDVTVSDQNIADIARMEEDIDLPQNLLEEEFMTYTHLLGQKKGLSINHLINAIKFCNLKRTRTNRDAWAITFPAKYDERMAMDKPVDNHVAMFNGTWLVKEIDKAMAMTVGMQYSGAFHQAMNVNINMMKGNGGVDAEGEPIAVSAMVRHLAAKTVLEIAKPNEETIINVKQSSSDEMVAVQTRQVDVLEQILIGQQEEFKRGAKPIDVQQIYKRVAVQDSDSVDAELEDM